MSTASSSWALERRRRPAMLMIFFAVSMAGLVSGLALRPIVRHLVAMRASPTATSVATATVSATATPDLPALTPEAFALNLTGTPLNVAPAGTFALTVHAALSRDATLAARGVSCAVQIDGLTLTPVPNLTLTDAQGNSTWTLQIPAGTAPGTYSVTVTAHWGLFSYHAYVLIHVQGANG